MDTHREFEIRCPVHGFIPLNDWEWEVINQPAFQRLRRVRQLAWSDYIYPGAMHTRFEHSLGVMHTATMLYESIVRRSKEILHRELAYNDDGLGRDLQLVRLAALLHDVGHGPFSHAAEELLPVQSDGRTRFKHEHYSAAIVRTSLRDAIENHPRNRNYGFQSDDVAALLEGSARAKQSLFWRVLIDGQMDADRMDYLLRDSHHAGVQYGRYDLHRVVATIQVIPDETDRGPRLGISEGGWHGAEGLVLARYFMFTQVYFHKTRVAYDIHLREALKTLLPGGVFPKPNGTDLNDYLTWEDWRVLGLLANGQGGEHGTRLTSRNHFRLVHHTPEVASRADLEILRALREKLGDRVAAEESASKSWYKTGSPDIPVLSDDDTVKPLSTHSTVLSGLKSSNQVLLYTRPEHASDARRIAKEVLKNHGQLSA